jgi:replication factor C large subunit
VWVEKYRPRTTSELVGNEEARLAVSLWLRKWKPRSKPMLIVGPPGTGKTTLVTLLAAEAGINMVALNASDVRTKDKLGRRIGEATKTVSLFGGRSLIFLDEVDGLLGRSDYGGVEFIKDAVKETMNPIIMAANDPEADEIKKLGAACITVRFRPPPPREVELYLRRIAREEKLEVSDEEIRLCVRTGGGDLRQSINSLQSGGGDASASKKDVSLGVGQGLNAFFEAADASSALDALRQTALQPVEKVREIQKSVLKADLSPQTLTKVLETLSRADVLMGKIMRTQQWRLLRYLDGMLAQELHPLLKGSNARYIATGDLPFPILLRIWNDSKKVKEISRRYAVASHTGAASARTQDLPYIFSLCSDEQFRERLERTLDLDETFEKFLQKEAGR